MTLSDILGAHRHLRHSLSPCLRCEGGMATKMQIITRIRRKVEIIRMDAKAKQDASYHDMNELLTLLDMLERALTKEQGNGNEN
jgi:hypothetical protein